MKPISAVIDTVNTPKFVKFTSFTLLSLSIVFLFSRFSSSFSYPYFSISSALVSDEAPVAAAGKIPPPTYAPPPRPRLKVSPPPLPPTIERTGIVDVTGAMSDKFEIGEFDPNLIEEFGGNGSKKEGVVADGGGGRGRFRVQKFKVCEESKRDYIPCLDNEVEIKRLNSSGRGEKFERHCPVERLDCLVPRPIGYKKSIPWPQSRDEVWFSNVPHTRLVEDKSGQNWISIKGDKFVFPGGGTQFIHGADEYLNQISQMVPDIAFGQHTRVVLDIGCGVASFGAFLMQRNVTTLSIAPKDIHENQIQFALERGVPAMVAVFATRRLLYPSQAFDMIHCSRCRINWTRDDGILLLEANRMLRAGGYFVWAAQPVYKHEEKLQHQWKEMVNLTTRLCWELVKKERYIAVWKKPLNNTCYVNRDNGTQLPLCTADDDPDKVWNVSMKPCITRLPENGFGANISTWPARLHDFPDRLQSIQMDAYISRKEIMKAESKYWKENIDGYVGAFHWKDLKLRNVLDMRAGFGGFAAALHDVGIDCWVMNVVPVSGFNTLPVIYDRGLIGVMHDWCEPFDTYPRTYDLINAAGLFTMEKKRCKVADIMLEMDRMLRPGGRVYILDLITVMDKIEALAKAMGWVAFLRDTAEGPHASQKLLMCEKRI